MTGTLGNMCAEKQSAEWHIGVIAQLMFTLSFGLMAIVLSLGGLCSSSLPRKIYYYHSAGEIHVICAISSGVTLVLHVVSTDGERRLMDQPWGVDGVWFGSGFLLVAGAMASFVAGAISLCLDDIVRGVTRLLYHCQRRRAPATAARQEPMIIVKRP